MLIDVYKQQNTITMPRVYKKAEKNQWSDEQLQAAMEAVSSGELKAHAAAKRYGIPSSTLYDNVKGKSSKRYGGAPTVLTAAEEKEIVTACQVLQEFGFPLTTNVVGQIVKDYLTSTERRNPFTDLTPGYEWWQGFLRRWPVLRQRKPEHLPRNRAQGARPEVKIK